MLDGRTSILCFVGCMHCAARTVFIASIEALIQVQTPVTYKYYNVYRLETTLTVSPYRTNALAAFLLCDNDDGWKPLFNILSNTVEGSPPFSI